MSAAPTRSQRYYWDSIEFLVENELYKVPRWAFERRSSVFASLLNAPRHDKRVEKPVQLHDVTKNEFDSFLSVLYPTGNFGLTCVQRELLHGHQLTATEWEHVLKLSSKYRFNEIRVLAIKQLWKLEDAVHRVRLGRQYGVPDWLRSGYMQLVIQEQSLSEAEAEDLGWRMAVRIFKLRESALLRGGSDGDEEKAMSSKDLMRLLGDMFAEDIQAAEELHDQHDVEPEDLEDGELSCPTVDSRPLDLGKELI
ncbi:hypothetical protein DL96DRAFT_1684248 [Flagelloscypha sp. PMI_526]|nr:hypothetical protein DL96DRAFT_1684248 [Flagelloscypha sp. PMI_526]